MQLPLIVTTVVCCLKRSIKSKRKSLCHVCLFILTWYSKLIIYSCFFSSFAFSVWSSFIFIITKKYGKKKLNTHKISFVKRQWQRWRRRQEKKSSIIFIDALQEKVLKRVIHTVKEVVIFFFRLRSHFHAMFSIEIKIVIAMKVKIVSSPSTIGASQIGMPPISS